MHQPFTLMQYNKLRQKDTKSIDAKHKDLSKIYGRKKFAATKMITQVIMHRFQT